jgi:hypothetical protein
VKSHFKCHFKSHFKCHFKSNLNTNERTNVLTKKALTSRGEIALVDTREQHPKHPCICLSELESCPDNCFLRWY